MGGYPYPSNKQGKLKNFIFKNNMSHFARVRVTCQSMKQSAEQNEKQKKQVDDWNKWQKEKMERIDKLQKIKNKLGQVLEQENYSPQPNQNLAAELVVSVIDGTKDNDGYARLQDIESVNASRTDLAKISDKKKEIPNCFSCNLM